MLVTSGADRSIDVLRWFDIAHHRLQRTGKYDIMVQADYVMERFNKQMVLGVLLNTT
jgi:hypothetical protein